MRDTQIETAELTDADLDNVSGGAGAAIDAAGLVGAGANVSPGGVSANVSGGVPGVGGISGGVNAGVPGIEDVTGLAG